MAEQEINGLDELRRAMKSLKSDPVILPSGVEIEDTRPIEVGDVVQLKSGGAKMTVVHLGDGHSCVRALRNILCAHLVWMDDDGCFHEATIPVTGLERAKKLESLFGRAIGRNSQISFGQPTLDLVKWNVDDETESDEVE